MILPIHNTGLALMVFFVSYKPATVTSAISFDCKGLFWVHARRPIIEFAMRRTLALAISGLSLHTPSEAIVKSAG